VNAPAVLLAAAEEGVRAAVAARLAEAGLPPADRTGPGVVVVAAGRTVGAALAARPFTCRCGGCRLVVLADSVEASEVLRALRAGALAVLESTADGARLAAAVGAASRGEGRLPHTVLRALLDDEPAPPARSPVASPVLSPVPSAVPSAVLSPLTARQTAVLALMAEGHGNAAIARALSCSAHTVKNVIYDLMARLQVRNRSHAVAHAVRAGLI
jgi:DNA-binding NarL/FixJ family response regulator